MKKRKLRLCMNETAINQHNKPIKYINSRINSHLSIVYSMIRCVLLLHSHFKVNKGQLISTDLEMVICKQYTRNPEEERYS